MNSHAGPVSPHRPVSATEAAKPSNRLVDNAVRWVKGSRYRKAILLRCAELSDPPLFGGPGVDWTSPYDPDVPRESQAVAEMITQHLITRRTNTGIGPLRCTPLGLAAAQEIRTPTRRRR